MKSVVNKLMPIVALRNEKGSYNGVSLVSYEGLIVALRNEKGSYNCNVSFKGDVRIVALRNEKGSYNYVRKAQNQK